MIVAGRSCQLLDERRARGLAHYLPGLIDHNELAGQIDPDRVPEHRQRSQLSDRSNLGIAEGGQSNDDELLIAQGRRPPREDQG